MTNTDGDELDQLIATAEAACIAYLGPDALSRLEHAEVFIPTEELSEFNSRGKWHLRNAKSVGIDRGACEEDLDWDAGWEQGAPRPDSTCGDHYWAGAIRLRCTDDDYYSHLPRPGWTPAQLRLFCELREERDMPPSQALEVVETFCVAD